MYLCLSDENQSTASSKRKKLTGSQKLQIAYGKEKLGTILRQVNASQNSRQTIDNTHNEFQPLLSIIAERFDNIIKDQSNYYIREENKNEFQLEKT